MISSLLVSILCDSKNSHCMPHDSIDLYIFNITLRTFPDIPHDTQFFYSVALLIESNALQ